MNDRHEEAAKRNRERMPGTARIIDEWRAKFGPVVVRHASEPGAEVGKPTVTDPARTMNADQWLRFVKTGELPEGKRSPWEPPCT